MKCLLSILLLAAGAATAAGETDLRFPLRVTDHPIRVDGIIDEVWSRADSVTRFFQLQPFFNQPPTRHTVAKLLTSPEALYCLIVAYDDRVNIQDNTGVLDQASGDIVSLMLDTFGDKQSAYKFAVTASGTRADCRLLDDARNRDYSWDGVWFASSSVHDWGYVVEMEIPYASIKFDPTLPAWGLDFDRWIPINSEDLYWAPYEQNEGQRISKFGVLELNGFRPSAKGLNLELYPVGFARASYLENGGYKVEPNAGLDIFYNPSERLTAQVTVNPDFAQIEADPFAFNISRYETYFDERRPFFTEGNEIFMASGRERSSGFYRPLELFYSRRIGRILPGGVEVPLQFGTKAFGRAEEWEYGGFVSVTGEEDYSVDGERRTEPRATFASARVKRTILENSSVGVLFVGKNTREGTSGVVDVDGALRGSEWQLAYQLARSFDRGTGDFGGSAGFGHTTKTWIYRARVRAIGADFNVDQVGFVPWRGTFDLVAFTGPRWYNDEGPVRATMLYAGPAVSYEHADLYTDWVGLLGFNQNFRANWGYEINLTAGRAKDQGVVYTSYEANFSSWFNVNPRWNANIWAGYSNTYNFTRDYLAFYSWAGFWFMWKPAPFLDLGTSFDTYMEGNPDGALEEVTFNARPEVTFSPFNNLRARVYVDNVFVRSTDRLESVIFGVLLSYNFLPKSWIYIAVNEVRNREEEFDRAGNALPRRMHVADRVGVFKVKYLLYF